MIKELNQSNFHEEIEGDLPVLVEFYRYECTPCEMLAPVLEEIAKTYVGKIKVFKVLSSDNMDLAKQFKIRTAPTTFLLNKETKTPDEIIYGFKDLESIKKIIEQYI